MLSTQITVRLLRLVASDDNDVIVEIDIDQNSRSQTAMFGFQIVESVGSCRELVANSHRRRDSTVESPSASTGHKDLSIRHRS